MPIHIVGIKEERTDISDGLLLSPSIGRRFIIQLKTFEQGDFITVYNTIGQRVRGLGLKDKNILIWNGDDDRGMPLPAGVYFVNLKTKDKFIVRRLILIR